MRPVRGLALLRSDDVLREWDFQRRDLRADDVAIDVMFCGVCASDLGAIRQATPQQPPLVPGHEFTGRVCAIGSEVSSFAVGDLVAVGNIVDSCGHCEECRRGFENYCRNFPTPTYLGTDRYDGRPQQGGFSSQYVASERFVHHLPPGLDPAAAAPLMCAGVTVWEALDHWRVEPGQRVGIVGLGGLGHLGVKFAKALGADVTVFTTTASKTDDAIQLGADDVVVSSNEAAMRRQARRHDLIVDTASAQHDPSPLLDALKLHGTLCLLGTPPHITVSSFSLRWGRHSLAGSGTGSPTSTARMLQFAAEHDIVADIELLPATAHQQALDRLAANDVKWRFVLDLAHLAHPRAH